MKKKNSLPKTYQESKVISIVNKDIEARFAAIKRREEVAKAGGYREPARRDWANIAYEDKEEAKRYGCRWCPIEKKWYASNFMSAKLVEEQIERNKQKKLKRLLKKNTK